MTATAGSVGPIFVFAALVVLLAVKSPFEERLLARRFAGYRAYVRVAPRFVPSLSRQRHDARSQGR